MALERTCVVEEGLAGLEVRDMSAHMGPQGTIAITSRQGLWFAVDDQLGRDGEEEGRGDEGGGRSRRVEPVVQKDAAGKWLDLGSVCWCPDAARAGWLAAVKQRSVMLWDAGLGAACGSSEAGGGRSLTDVDWGPMLVAGSMDGMISVFDPRDVGSPVVSLLTKTIGHTQVRCCRRNSNLLASAHAGNVLVWDVRAGKRPLATMMAHVSNKVGKIDWSPCNAEELVTCSPTESEVKLWRVSQPQQEHATLKMCSHVSSAMFSPSGDMLLTAHADCRLRLTAISTSSTLLTIPTATVVERRVDWVCPVGDASVLLPWRVAAITSPVGGSRVNVLKEWVLSSQPEHAAETAERANSSADSEGEEVEDGYNTTHRLLQAEDLLGVDSIHIT
ncbi:hypothetical protein GUITHDRAFT_149341 [Guillardia theta CCMP2712]|uniref:Uncharacterized protein n=1 Tax=Guillardia theta (strain CCMP2712) TaxID=905079 RepID=L1I5L7_GUITC|nr:hypothetical protein GUITHDRAFT_149341 [Guillardia theta CCMP2712]EKX31367.1 hypothetical protein GUITHDRAFT_149341 [Guillardia theta CCMP2712]|eukprot:XP_005818347.1 hypothetical protein GUITHDRAFT_149341 [Guillardia theta CCMP2712]